MRQYYLDQQADLARFRRDTRNHRMTVVKDDGLFRYIQVRNPSSISYSFNITTIPGYLIYTGDMGSYAFSRERDMFDFHRIEFHDHVPAISYDYMAQKCEAIDRRCGTEGFDSKSFVSAAVQRFREGVPCERGRLNTFKEFRWDILDQHYQNSEQAIGAVMRWDSPLHSSAENVFSEFYEEGPFTKPSFHFKWACWAIACTIRDYDRGGDRFTRQEAADKLILKGGHHVHRRTS